MLAARVHSRTKLKVGDVVCAKDLQDPSRVMIKRVAGTSGDIMEKKIGGPGMDDVGKRSIVVPPGHVWLLGDNGSVSRDSRDIGYFPLGMVMAVSLQHFMLCPRAWLGAVVVALPGYSWLPPYSAVCTCTVNSTPFLKN